MELVDSELLFVKLLSPLVPETYFTATPTPADGQRSSVTVLSTVPADDPEEDSGYRYDINFIVTAESRSKALAIANSIHYCMKDFGESITGIEGVGHVGFVYVLLKTARSSAPSSDAYSYTSSYRVTLSL